MSEEESTTQTETQESTSEKPSHSLEAKLAKMEAQFEAMKAQNEHLSRTAARYEKEKRDTLLSQLPTDLREKHKGSSEQVLEAVIEGYNLNKGSQRFPQQPSEIFDSEYGDQSFPPYVDLNTLEEVQGQKRVVLGANHPLIRQLNRTPMPTGGGSGRKTTAKKSS